MRTLTLFHPESSYLRFGAWSVLLHLGAVATLGVLPVTSSVDTRTPRVTVTLLTPPVARKPLPDRRADDTMQMKNFTKTPARRATPTTTAAVPQKIRPTVITAPNAAKAWSFANVPTPAPSPPRTDAPKVFRDTTADRKGLRTPARRLGGGDQPYPPAARKRGWEGTVVLRITISREGTVEQAVVHTSSGFPILDESALQTVQTWEFEPARDGEFAVPATVEQSIRFTLDEP